MSSALQGVAGAPEQSLSLPQAAQEFNYPGVRDIGGLIEDDAKAVCAVVVPQVPLVTWEEEAHWFVLSCLLFFVSPLLRTLLEHSVQSELSAQVVLSSCKPCVLQFCSDLLPKDETQKSEEQKPPKPPARLPPS